MDATRRAHGWPTAISLSDHLPAKILPPAGLHKVRVIYDAAIQQMEILPYQLPRIRSLRLLPADHLHYRYKYADRTALNECYARRGDNDDILLLRNGLLTDTSYANIALYDGDQWWTPARPLLPGTRRAQLLEKGLLHEADLLPADLCNFMVLRLINAMIRLEDRVGVRVEDIG